MRCHDQRAEIASRHPGADTTRRIAQSSPTIAATNAGVAAARMGAGARAGSRPAFRERNRRALNGASPPPKPSAMKWRRMREHQRRGVERSGGHARFAFAPQALPRPGALMRRNDRTHAAAPAACSSSSRTSPSAPARRDRADARQRQPGADRRDRVDAPTRRGRSAEATARSRRRQPASRW